MIVGLTVVSLGLVVADYLLLRSQAKQRHEQHYHRGGKTNTSAPAPPPVGQNQVTNHE